ncbi:MAG: DUF4430 domain-containing protein [Bacillota bacterium]
MSLWRKALTYLLPLFLLLAALLGPLLYNQWSGVEQTAGQGVAQQQQQEAGGQGGRVSAGSGLPAYTDSDVGQSPAGSCAPVPATPASASGRTPNGGVSQAAPQKKAAASFEVNNTAGSAPGSRVGAAAGGSAQNTGADKSPPAPAAAAGSEVGQDGGTAGTVGLAVVGRRGELIYGPALLPLPPGRQPSALELLDLAGLPYQLSPRFPGFVTTIAGQENKGQSGWMYKVNQEIPACTADRKVLQPGDRVIWWYSNKMGDPVPRWEDLKK